MSATSLKPLVALQYQPHFIESFAKVVSDSRGKLCSVCGLERMGHAPESQWLGFEPHQWEGVPGDVKRARALPSEAYQRRREAK